MKKVLLMISGLALAATLNAQQRLVLYEEFTGANCPPCASTNPPLWGLMSASGNSSKIVMIKYQSPIPSADPYFSNPSTSDVAAQTNRLGYYQVNFAPWGEMDGGLPPGILDTMPNANHPGYVVQGGQSMIDMAAAVPTPYTINITNFSISGGMLNATVEITSSSVASGTSMKLRAALAETLNFSTAPGTNGEMEFENVVRAMYPDANGQTIPNSWTANQTQTFNISGPVPSYVDLNNDHMLVVWIQDDGDHSIMQTAKAEETTGINELVEDNGFNIYPNPVQNNLVVDLNMVHSAKVNLSVVNILGQQISSTDKDLNAGQNKVNLATTSLAPGVYFLKMTANGNTIQKKFVKE